MAISIPEITNEPAIDISLDTINNKKQALVFCNTRRSSEATAEKIAKKIKGHSEELDELGNKILKVLSSPTRQCKRLAYCVRKGTAFHHAGLAAGQRKIIEDSFRLGTIKIICSTPTLAMGINLPAFRTVLKDLKRYGGRWGMQFIPTLEYHQMAGRAGRPDFNDKHGEAICLAKNKDEAEEILEKFIKAKPEKIYSKLAVEPVLRTYCLSLVATGFCKSKKTLIEFFEQTFYGHQYGDMQQLEKIIEKILGYLEEWEFIKYSGQANDFISANDLGSDKIEATRLGQRVAQLYLDPYTAHFIITCLRRATQKMADEFSYVQMACSTLELRPLSSVRVREVEAVEAELAELSDSLIIFEPSVFDPDYDDFLKSVKTALAMRAWMDEDNEDDILEQFNIAPGELHVKRNLIDWILFATEELASLLNFRQLIAGIRKTRYRLDKGVKEELVPLVRVRGIGRIRARTLYRNGIKDIGGLKNASLTKLKQLLGPKTASNIKKQLGQDVEEVKKGKRKGQTSLRKQMRD